jgi:hypothetical protein
MRGVEQQGQGRIHRLGFVPRCQFAQGALALAVLARELGHRLIGTSLRLVQIRRPEFGAAGFETRLGLTHGGQRVLDHALALPAGGIDHRLRAGFGLQQALQLIVHRLTGRRSAPGRWPQSLPLPVHRAAAGRLAAMPRPCRPSVASTKPRPYSAGDAASGISSPWA